MLDGGDLDSLEGLCAIQVMLAHLCHHGLKGSIVSNEVNCILMCGLNSAANDHSLEVCYPSMENVHC